MDWDQERIYREYKQARKKNIVLEFIVYGVIFISTWAVSAFAPKELLWLFIGANLLLIFLLTRLLDLKCPQCEKHLAGGLFGLFSYPVCKHCGVRLKD